MIRKIFAICVCTFIAAHAIGQPAEPSYFQQYVKYFIHVKLDDVNHELSGDIRIDYKNNSPETLNFILFHLWPNGYKDETTALAKQLLPGTTKFHFSKPESKGYIDSLTFSVDGQKTEWTYDSIHSDIAKIMLHEPLPRGGSVSISTPFHVKIPSAYFSRLGHIDQSYMISQWYPKPAVYDRKGWHAIPYLNQGEFYSEIGEYDVEITVPSNYVVGATGDYVDGEKELAWLTKKADSTFTLLQAFDETQTLPKKSKTKDAFPASDTTTKTLHFLQRKVHDFAWFADKRFLVLKGEVELPYNKRKVTTWTMFTPSSKKYWKKSIDYVNNAVYEYSFYNGDYPYNHATAVDGTLAAGGGMEYPNITVIGTSSSALELENVILHEVGHNWFYGILGSNERDHAWMDEGINSFNENRIMAKKHPSASSSSINNTILKALGASKADNRSLLEVAYWITARQKLDQPIDLTSSEYSELNYGSVVYEKTAMVFDYLKEYLGDELFDSCMRTYFETWKFKHPYPADLQEVFTSITHKNLDWFFSSLLNTTDPIDYKILKARQEACLANGNANCLMVTVANKGEISSPFSLTAYKNDSIIYHGWFDGFASKSTITLPIDSYDELRIDAEKKSLDFNPKNNIYTSYGLFKKVEPLKLKLIGGIENPDRTQICFMPIVGWNISDRWMPGIAFYNNLLPMRRFEYTIVPMYSFKAQGLNGLSNIGINWYSHSSAFQRIRLGISAKKFSEDYAPKLLAFQKIAPELSIRLKKDHAYSTVSRSIQLRNVNILKQHAGYSVVESDYFIYNETYYVNELKYTVANSRKLNPFSCQLSLQQGDGFVKSSLEATFSITFKKSRPAELRFFAGKFLSNNFANDFGFALSGNNDYMYDQIFLGRNERTGTFSQQFNRNEGGFRNQYASTSADDWLASVSATLPIPRLPFAVYADAGFADYSTRLEYNAGIAFIPIRGFFEVYFPLAMPEGLHNYRYGEKIRFSINFNLANPFELISKTIN